MASQLQDVIVKKSFSVRGKTLHPGEPVTLTRIEAAGKIDAGYAKPAPAEPTTMVIMSQAIDGLKKDQVIDMSRDKADGYLDRGLADKWGPRRGRVAHAAKPTEPKKALQKRRTTTKVKPPHDNKQALPLDETKNEDHPSGGDVPGLGAAATKTGDTPPVEPLPLDDFKALKEAKPKDARAHARLFGLKARGLDDLTEKFAEMLAARAG